MDIQKGIDCCLYCILTALFFLLDDDAGHCRETLTKNVDDTKRIDTTWLMALTMLTQYPLNMPAVIYYLKSKYWRLIGVAHNR